MFRNLFRTHRPQKPRRLSQVRPDLEALEDRTVPATLVGLTTTDRLLFFDSATPNVVQRKVAITGVGQQDVVGIDTRPANGLIYALTSANRLYTINPVSGRATRIGTDPVGLDLVGTRVGVDFNPTVDRLRVTTNQDQNFRYNPVTGAVITPADDDLAYDSTDDNMGANPNIVDVAYDRNFQGSTQTTLYGIDVSLNNLVTIGGVDGTPLPDTGRVFTVGSTTTMNLGVNPGNRLGFDIAADGTAYAAFEGNNGMAPLRLYTINLSTGAATVVGTIGNGSAQLDGLAVLSREEIVYGVTMSNRLISFRADSPGHLLSATSIKGLIVGENISSMDFRPASGELFALTSNNRVLRIDPVTGQATQVGTPIPTALLTQNSPGGIDFNPTVDRLRLVNVLNDNLRYDPNTFAPVDADNDPNNGVQADTDLMFAVGVDDPNEGQDPNIVGVAYDRNDNDDISPPNTGTPTTLWGVDSNRDTLVRIGGVDGTPSPNLGTVFTIGDDPEGDDNLGEEIGDLVGFDIAGAGTLDQGVALMAAQVDGQTTSTLFSVNINDSTDNQEQGAVTAIGTIGGGELVRAMAIAPPTVQFGTTSVTVNEGAGTATITITRTGGADVMAQVLLSALPGTATGGDDGDFDDDDLINAMITFNRGETTKTVTIPIVNDTDVEDNETVLLSLTSPTGGTTLLGAGATATLTIKDND
jgi:hypothetical protein